MVSGLCYFSTKIERVLRKTQCYYFLLWRKKKLSIFIVILRSASQPASYSFNLRLRYDFRVRLWISDWCECLTHNNYLTQWLSQRLFILLIIDWTNWIIALLPNLWRCFCCCLFSFHLPSLSLSTTVQNDFTCNFDCTTSSRAVTSQLEKSERHSGKRKN